MKYTLQLLSGLLLAFMWVSPSVAAEAFHERMVASDLQDPMEISVAPDGDVYVIESGGHAPIDDRAEHEHANAMRAYANTNDLRGKILRIRPTAAGYNIPAGNLFPAGTPGTKQEMYVMGCRNPFRLSMDEKSHTLYWGEVGSDADQPGVRRAKLRIGAE